MIESFTKAQFEDALSTLQHEWEYYGYTDGEHTYLVRIPERRAGVLIRSSVKASGSSADSGEDSIRIVLINTATQYPLSQKVDAWTQRVSGWQSRMADKVNILYQKGLSMYNCPQCSKGVLMKKEGKFGVFWGCSNYPNCRYTTRTEPKEQPQYQDIDIADILDAASDAFDFIDEAEFEVAGDSEPVVTKEIKLNAQQRAYVEAPIDANIRVMATAGAGKTASTIERIVYLIQHGVNPENIAYVTFTKAMADEGYKRIVKRVPDVADSVLSRQICTIHALCYRILAWEGIKRSVPKDWEIKAALTAIIGGEHKQNIIGEWQYASEVPGFKEVLYWIDNAKLQGITPNADIAFFSRYMIADHAMKVHNARVRFDEWLAAKNYITFSDMLYTVEQRLINNRAFRTKYQSRFTHILVDECQDLSRQTLFILCALSVHPADADKYQEIARWRQQ